MILVIYAEDDDISSFNNPVYFTYSVTEPPYVLRGRGFSEARILKGASAVLKACNWQALSSPLWRVVQDCLDTFSNNIRYQDEAKSEVRIESYARVLGTPAVLLMPAAWTEWVENKLIDAWSMPFVEHDHALLAYEGDTCCGFLTYRDYTNELWIASSYVVPHCRRRGVYTKLFEKLKGIAADQGMARISSGVYTGNHAMLSTATSVGRRKHAEIWTYDVPKKGPSC